MWLCCASCVVACKDAKNNPVGVKFRRIYTQESGNFSKDKNGDWVHNVSVFNTSLSCNHCADPKCTKGCPTGALSKRAEDGIVLIDSEKCVGCRYCEWNCPYGAPQFNPDLGIMTKCNTCIELREKGENPACVGACIMRAIEFGPIEELRKKYGTTAEVKGIPCSTITNPNLVINPHKDALR